MFFIKLFMGQPTDYIIKFVNGRIKKEGVGISFFYIKSRTTIISMPITVRDANFIFNEMTHTFQSVTIQGQLTYKINDFKKIFSMLDFSVDPKTRQYLSDDPEKLSQRIINTVQMATRDQIRAMSLEEVLHGSELIAKNVLEKLKNDNNIASLGIELVSIYFISITPIPEIAKALEADYREHLQKKADEAIYARRAAAAEQELIIKQNEMNGQIDLEKRRQEMVDLNGNNKIKESEYKSKAWKLEWEPYKDLDPRMIVALGIKSLGESGSKINSINLTPDLLSMLLGDVSSKKEK